uniref:protein RETARDED ROOT GROWTH-LIKE-like n=1 Tax=Erigeron canadensis TaxID=72917 RepID=UPI001CB993C2|nr:protein RETARDED ROOT GROWTH-LIKE-like [Erigeron canadensis]
MLRSSHHKLINHHTTTTLFIPYISSQTLTNIRTFRTLITLASHPTTTTTLFTPSQLLHNSVHFQPNLVTVTDRRFSHFYSPVSPVAREFIRSKLDSVLTKCISSSPSLSPVMDTVAESDRNQAVVEDSGDEDSFIDKDVKTPIPVKAYFFSTSVDLKKLEKENSLNYIHPTSRNANYAVFRFGSPKPEHIGLGASISGSDISYMVVFQYGSIVLFNVRDHEIDMRLQTVKKHAQQPFVERRIDEYEVKEKPTLETWMEGGLDYIMLQYLNIDGIRTISSVLGQSIALDHYVRQVDGMVGEFTEINRGMEKTGTFTMERKKLFQLVGKANSNLADVIIKLGLFERSDIAWKDAKYAQIWEYLRDEFELTQRFASLDFKLKFVEHNIRFLQEIMQNRKSDFLEWLIIVLIGAEILISVYDIAHKSVL